MPKAASRSIKPKPVAMLCRRRLTSVLWTRKAAIATIAATNRTWRTMPRTRGSRHGAGRLGLNAPAVSLTIAASSAPRSADRDRVDQPAVGPQIIIAPLELERRAQAEMPVEHFAVITDGLD